MKPVKSNTAEQGCIPVSSNCVVWQGPNIACLNLCTGDSVSDVVYKVAEQLCILKSSLNISDVDLDQLLSFCSSVGPAPTTKTLSAVLGFIINKLQCVNTKVDAIPAATQGYQEPTINFGTTDLACLKYKDPVTGNEVTQLIHNQFSILLGKNLCQLKTTVASQSNILNDHEFRIKILEGKNTATLQVTPNCTYPGITASTPADIDDLVDAIDAKLCLLRRAIGEEDAITQAASKAGIYGSVCAAGGDISASQALARSQGTTMSGAYASLGWSNTVVNLSQSIQNLWITVLDMRCVIKDLKDCCGSNKCSEFILDFAATTDSSRSQITINFFNKTSIPSGYINCTGTNGSVIKITDGVTTLPDIPLDLVGSVLNTNGITIPVTGGSVTSPLDPNKDYKVTIVGCISKDTTNCVKTKEVIIYKSCNPVTIVIVP